MRGFEVRFGSSGVQGFGRTGLLAAFHVGSTSGESGLGMWGKRRTDNLNKFGLVFFRKSERLEAVVVGTVDGGGGNPPPNSVSQVLQD